MKIMILALLGLIPVQSTTTSPAGTWIAEHQGTTFIRLELKGANTALAGAIGTGNLTVDDAGDVSKVTPVPAALTPLFKIAVSGSSITFLRQEGDEPEQFRLNLLGADQAELILVLSEDVIEELKDEGIPVPKPIRLHKIR